MYMYVTNLKSIVKKRTSQMAGFRYQPLQIKQIINHNYTLQFRDLCVAENRQLID